MPIDEKAIYVYADLENNPKLMGRLFVGNARGKEIFSFEYCREWIQCVDTGCVLDPDIQLYEGRQYVPQDKTLFGVFSDSCPDRWGRLLLQRKETILARKDGRKPRALAESDYLLGVYDRARLGALRFSLEERGPFLASYEGEAIPPWTTLRALESASLAFERDESGLDEKWLSQLLAPGSSLGGARPKASVQAPDGSLWIAKFPSKHDQWNSGAWEIVAHNLADLCGLNVPEAKLETFTEIGSTFLVKRFDRYDGRRIHFSSAMALLGKSDGISAEGTGYLDLAALIKSKGAQPKKDLYELWKRIVFNMAVSNTDDHLRNHGFLLTKNGWILSPQYDVNPNIYGDSLSLYITLDDNTIDFELAVETAEHYGIGVADAKNTIAEIKKIVEENWRKLAANYSLSKDAIKHMEPAFVG